MRKVLTTPSIRKRIKNSPINPAKKKTKARLKANRIDAMKSRELIALNKAPCTKYKSTDFHSGLSGFSFNFSTSC
jgi:hypothetical protein